jgi:hypothetical protein
MCFYLAAHTLNLLSQRKSFFSVISRNLKRKDYKATMTLPMYVGLFWYLGMIKVLFVLLKASYEGSFNTNSV